VIKIGLIGPGKWGLNIIKSIHMISDLEISYICSKNQKSERNFFSNCKHTTDWKELINSDEVDAVVIATPPVTHYEMLNYAIKQKKPTFVEKPHCLSSIDAQNLLQEAEKNKSIVIVDHIYLHNKSFQDLKKKLNKSNKKLFKIRSFGGNNGPFRKDIGILWDYGPHDIALCIDLLQEYPVSIKAFYDKKINDINGETIYIELRFKIGATANITISNQLKKRTRILEVEIDKNSYLFDDTNATFIERQMQAKTPLENALIKFKDKILEKKKYLDDLKLGLIVVNVLEECQKQISTNDEKC